MTDEPRDLMEELRRSLEDAKLATSGEPLSLDDIGRARGCVGPYPCGRGAGANDADLPCDCESIALECRIGPPRGPEALLAGGSRLVRVVAPGGLAGAEAAILAVCERSTDPRRTPTGRPYRFKPGVALARFAFMAAPDDDPRWRFDALLPQVYAHRGQVVEVTDRGTLRADGQDLVADVGLPSWDWGEA